MKAPSARESAFLSLRKTVCDRAFSNLENAAALSRLDPMDKAFFTALYLGTVEKKITLDYLLGHFSSTPVEQLDPDLRTILELGAYQILYLDAVPDRAAVDESVRLARRRAPRGAGLVNAVLRRLAEKKETVPALLERPGKKGLSVRYSMPKYLVSLWADAYGEDRCRSILEAFSEPPALSVRVNTAKIEKAVYEEKLRAAGIAFHPNAVCENALTTENLSDPRLLPGFEAGECFVQDAAAQRAVEKLGIRKGQTVLDLCAAPGGKSFLAALLAGEEGRVFAFDLRENRLPLIRQGAERLGLSIPAAVHDATLPLPEWEGKADRVICDVPCSGFGVIAKKPDIRLKTREDSAGLPELQSAILRRAAALVAPGGRILYSTCTLNPAENEEVTDDFLRREPGFVRAGEAETLFPAAGENDGFFADVLEKKA